MSDKPKKLDKLTPEEVQEFRDGGPFYVPGRAYVWILTYGWCIVGFYVGHENPLAIRVAHANHFHTLGTDYGTLVREGPPKNCEWRYEGNSLVSIPHVIRADEYGGEVPRSKIRSS